MAQEYRIPPPLQEIPDDIQVHRQMMFSLDQPVHFTTAVYEKYFPYIDNVWCFHDPKGGKPAKTGIEKLRGACRFNRKPNAQRQNMVQRQRRAGTGSCPAKFRLTIHPDGTRTMERFEDTRHSHDLEFIDAAKRNSAVRSIIVNDYFKGWDAGAVLAFLRDPVHKANGRDVLREAGGHHISRTEISNVVTAHMRKVHPGQDPFEIRRQQDKYKSYVTCSVKGCRAPPFADAKDFKKHRQEAHGFIKHDHSHKTPCPAKGCPRHKPSRGFPSLIALKQHVQRYHEGTPLDAVEGQQDAASINRSDDGEISAEALESLVNENDREEFGDRPTMHHGDALAGMNEYLSEPSRRDLERRLETLERDRDRINDDIARVRASLDQVDIGLLDGRLA